MDSNAETGGSLALMTPIYKRLAEIRSLFETTGEQRIFSKHTLKRQYFDYELDQDRQEQKVTLKDFYDSLISEIQGYRKGLIATENNYKKGGLGMDCYPVLTELEKCKELVEEQIRNFDAGYNTVAKIEQTKNKFPNIKTEAETISREVKKSKNVISTLKTFGFKGDINKLGSCLKELDVKMELTKKDSCTINDLLIVLTSTDFSVDTPGIYLNCETAQFSFIIDKVSNLFSTSFKKNIETSKKFFSKSGNIITANNLYQAKKKSPHPKLENEMNIIFEKYLSH